MTQFLVFRVDQHRYVLPLSSVTRVIRAVEVTPLPGAPPGVLGAINVHGRVMPVFDVRRRFGIAPREIRASDWFLLAQTQHDDVVLVVDEAHGVIESPQADVASTRAIPRVEAFPGIVKLEGELLLIHDLERFLSVEETHSLEAALKNARTQDR